MLKCVGVCGWVGRISARAFCHVSGHTTNEVFQPN